MAKEKLNQQKKTIDGVVRREKRTDSDFFVEIEKQNFSVFWFLSVIILLIVFSTLVFLAVKIKRSKIGPDNYSPSVTSESDLASFSDRVSAVKGYGLSTIGFSSKEFAVAMGVKNDDFPLTNAGFYITRDNILLTGKLRDSIIPFSVKIKIITAVTDKKFRFLVAPNSIENIVIYGRSKDKIESMFDQSINNLLEENRLIASGIEISDDRIELKVIKEPK